MRSLLVFLALYFAATVVVHNSTAQNSDQDAASTPKIYRVMERLEIDKLGLDGKLPPNDSDQEALERGLNLLYADGWELVAVEGGRMRTFNGGGDAALVIPPSYIFRQSDRCN
jgi:hypothetical protein